MLQIEQLLKSNESELLIHDFLNLSLNILLALLTILIFYGLWNILNKILSKSFTHYKTDLMTSSFILMSVKYIVLTMGIISALSKLGINTVSLMTSVGVLGLTVGFAAKDVLSNIISGVFIFWDRPFVIGDLVEINNYYGEVKDITLRTTRIVTSDGKMLAIPNTQVVNTIVASYSNYPNLRLDITFTISVHEDINKSRNLLLEMIAKDPDFMEKPAPRLVVANLNDYNTELQFQAWIKDERKHVVKRYELRENIFNILRDNGVDMPFETLKIEPLEIKKINNN